jgi:hypothetical protein
MSHGAALSLTPNILEIIVVRTLNRAFAIAFVSLLISVSNEHSLFGE